MTTVWIKEEGVRLCTQPQGYVLHNDHLERPDHWQEFHHRPLRCMMECRRVLLVVLQSLLIPWEKSGLNEVPDADIPPPLWLP